jgi:predicted O-methyltransferase YrrM
MEQRNKSNSGGPWHALYSQCKKLVGPFRLGMLEYLLGRRSNDPLGGPFNGQKARQDLFRHLLQACRPAVIVETGTYLGSSADFMAECSCLPVYSVEADARNYGFAKMRLRKHDNLKLSLGDSRQFITRFIEAEASKYAGHPLLFYLDAHWGEDLPLFEEIAKIFSACAQAIVMIDDFQVPDDDGYGYDDYGVGKALTREYIAPLVSQFQLAEFYPTTRSGEESGLRRGCVVVARNTSLIDALSRTLLLRRWEPSRLMTMQSE